MKNEPSLPFESEMPVRPPVRDSSEADQSGKPEQRSAAVLHHADPLFHKKRSFEFLCADHAVFIENVGVDVGDHVYLGMSGVAMCGFEVTVIQLRFAGRTGVPLWYNVLSFLFFLQF